MPLLAIREIGVSYLIEGLAPSGLDGERLLAAMQAAYGEAAAPMRIQPPPDDALTAILVDRRGDTRDGLRRRLEGWIADQGGSGCAWDDDPARGLAVVRFRRDDD